MTQEKKASRNSSAARLGFEEKLWAAGILRRYGYPPDKQQAATQTVLEQAESMGGAGVAA